MPLNTGDHGWMSRDDLRDGVIQNIAQWLPSSNVVNSLYGAYGDVQIVFDGSTDGSTTSLICPSAPFAKAVAGMTVVAAAPSATGARNDGTGGTGTVTVTSGSVTVLDNQAVAADRGKLITGAGIGPNNWVIDFSAGVSLTLAYPAIGNGTAVTVSAALMTTIASVTSASQIVLATGVANRVDGVGLSGFTVQFGHDDTAALQAAVDAAGTALYNLPAAPTSSVEIVLPAGNYFVNSASLLSPRNPATGGAYNWRTGSIVWRGAGEESTMLINFAAAVGANIGTAGSIFRSGNRTLSITTTVDSTTAIAAGALPTDVDAALTGNNMSGTQIAAVSGTSVTLSNPANATATANYTLQTRVPRFEWRDMTLFGNQLGTVDRLNRQIGCLARNSGGAIILSVPSPYQTQAEPHYPYQLGGSTGAARNDTGITLNPTTTTYVDPAITTLDIGSTVTNANIPANTTITAIVKATNTVTISNPTTNGTQQTAQTVAVQPYATSTATSSTTLTDSGANWAVNQWVGAILFMDEDKALNGYPAGLSGDGPGVGVGCGYAYVISNTPIVLNFLALIPTRGSGTYTPSGQSVRYRLHLGVPKPTTLPHSGSRVRVLGPRGFGVFPFLGGTMHFDACVLEQCGAPFETTHNDTFGIGAGTIMVTNSLFLGGRGSYCDSTGQIAGMFPRTFISGCRSINRNVSNLLCCGVGSVITNNNFESLPGSGSVGYDAQVIEANKGNNLVSGNVLSNMTINGTGLQGLSSTRNDRTSGNLTADSPLGVMASNVPAVPATTVAIRNILACDCTVIITAGSSTCAVAINGVAAQTLAASAIGSFRLPSTASIALTYTNAPTWTWIGD